MIMSIVLERSTFSSSGPQNTVDNCCDSKTVLSRGSVKFRKFEGYFSHQIPECLNSQYRVPTTSQINCSSCPWPAQWLLWRAGPSLEMSWVFCLRWHNSAHLAQEIIAKESLPSNCNYYLCEGQLQPESNHRLPVTLLQMKNHKVSAEPISISH